jgi:hypothetical protein
VSQFLCESELCEGLSRKVVEGAGLEQWTVLLVEGAFLFKILGSGVVEEV